ncbi:MAG: COX15/CtaA family protein, partial [Thermomicrobiales bacterium]|nr:COX15/CtaA family protein [Thermomicrobiales bacterium]
MSDMDARALEGAARTAALRNANACQQMAELCGELLAVAPELTPREFLRTLGALVAGIDAGRGYTDWPWMGGGVLPPAMWDLTPVWRNLF